MADMERENTSIIDKDDINKITKRREYGCFNHWVDKNRLNQA
jgi:hypothetical protein